MRRSEESSGTLPNPDSEDRPSIGTYLARQRHLRGISLEELAQLTRIPVRSLERLEAGSYDGVTDGFVRGFVRTVADSLGLEPTDTVARMLREPSLQDEVGSQPSLMFRRLLLISSGLIVLALAVGLVHAFTTVGETPVPEQIEHVFRRDVVRLLAQSERAERHRVAAQNAAEQAEAPGWSPAIEVAEVLIPADQEAAGPGDDLREDGGLAHARLPDPAARAAAID